MRLNREGAFVILFRTVHLTHQSTNSPKAVIDIGRCGEKVYNLREDRPRTGHFLFIDQSITGAIDFPFTGKIRIVRAQIGLYEIMGKARPGHIAGINRTVERRFQVDRL